MDKTKEKVLPSYTDPTKMANEFNKYYIEKVSKIRKSIPKINVESSTFSRLFSGEMFNKVSDSNRG